MSNQEYLIPPVFLGFDTETTGLDVERDRIVQASAVGQDAEGREVFRRDWLINPGILIPRQATKIHGITNEKVAAEGADPAAAVEEIVSVLQRALASGAALVVQNAPYDLSLLQAEARRYGVVPLTERRQVAPVLDPVMLARAAGVPGRHGLAALCSRFGVHNPQAHTAYSDTVTTLEVLRRLLELQELAELEPAELHEVQWEAARVKAKAWEEELRLSSPCARVGVGWPLYGRTRVECDCKDCGRPLGDDELDQPCAECRSRYPVAAG